MLLDRKCDFCGKKAHYDGRTKMGPWAYMCKSCIKLYGYPESKYNTLIAPIDAPEKEVAQNG